MLSSTKSLHTIGEVGGRNAHYNHNLAVSANQLLERKKLTFRGPTHPDLEEPLIISVFAEVAVHLVEQKTIQAAGSCVSVPTWQAMR